MLLSRECFLLLLAGSSMKQTLLIASFTFLSLCLTVVYAVNAQEPAPADPQPTAAATQQEAEPEVDQSTLPIEAYTVFSDLRVARPLLIATPPDDSGRLFIGSQLGELFVSPSAEAKADTLETFMDLSEKVRFRMQQNEEGFLGLAFHPKFKENGQFFIYYTAEDPSSQSTISRFHVSADNPNRADPDSEEIILTLQQKYWNHNGGTIAFGPDGYLYIAFGDGGSGGDPDGNGQNLSTFFASILRIDVDKKDEGKNYAIPPDNPFVNGPEGAKPEIWAYGLRNPWRFSFDKETGVLWEGEVGQDIWEEINIIQKGGNYGWSVREAFHPYTSAGIPGGNFAVGDAGNTGGGGRRGGGARAGGAGAPGGAAGRGGAGGRGAGGRGAGGRGAGGRGPGGRGGAASDVRPQGQMPFANEDPAPEGMINPIWEYRHGTVGNSITGGYVYRGKEFPELVGCFLYADYVRGKLWALKYDFDTKKVVANYQIQAPSNPPIIMIGEDPSGEPIYSTDGGDFYRLRRVSTEANNP